MVFGLEVSIAEAVPRQRTFVSGRRSRAAGKDEREQRAAHRYFADAKKEKETLMGMMGKKVERKADGSDKLTPPLH